MDLKYLEDTFKKVKDFYSIEDEVELLPDFKVKFKVFRNGRLSELIDGFQSGKYTYPEFLSKMFANSVTSINNIDVENLKLPDDVDLKSFLEKHAMISLDMNILDSFFLIIREHLTVLNEKAVATVKNESLQKLLKKSSDAFNKLDERVEQEQNSLKQTNSNKSSDSKDNKIS